MRFLTLPNALVGCVLIALVGCEEDPCPRGSMLDSAGALVVTIEEHPTGWGEARCQRCHVTDALHRIGCTPEVELQQLREQVADGEPCTTCHGTNGTEPSE